MLNEPLVRGEAALGRATCGGKGQGYGILRHCYEEGCENESVHEGEVRRGPWDQSLLVPEVAAERCRHPSRGPLGEQLQVLRTKSKEKDEMSELVVCDGDDDKCEN